MEHSQSDEQKTNHHSLSCNDCHDYDRLEEVNINFTNENQLENYIEVGEMISNDSIKNGRIPDNQHKTASTSKISSSTSPSPSAGKSKRTRSLISTSWNERFQELIQFREANDHCCVPHNYPENRRLSQWVRKQRHQRKRKERGLHSTLSDERQELLTNAGFIWDSHRAQWQERYQSLEVFQMTHGHSDVPSNFHDSSLSNWVKNQRKQYKLFRSGSMTAMDQERVDLLNSIGFNWNPRGL